MTTNTPATTAPLASPFEDPAAAVVSTIVAEVRESLAQGTVDAESAVAIFTAIASIAARLGRGADQRVMEAVVMQLFECAASSNLISASTMNTLQGLVSCGHENAGAIGGVINKGREWLAKLSACFKP